MSDFRNYVAVVEQNERGRNFAHLPDLPGVTAAGGTIDETLRRLADFADDYVEDLTKDGHDIPDARAWEEVPHDPEVKEFMRAYVPVRIPAKVPRTMKISISIDEDALERVDRAARLAGESRSGFFAVAASQRARELGTQPIDQRALVRLLQGSNLNLSGIVESTYNRPKKR
jgi:predicted RNase H-like HicB family nuclease/uncharacterized protein (DUF1778 family)